MNEKMLYKIVKLITDLVATECLKNRNFGDMPKKETRKNKKRDQTGIKTKPKRNKTKTVTEQKPGGVQHLK